MATLDDNSKADTRILLIRDGGGAANLKVDQSQWRTDLTNNTTYLTSTDTRLAVRSPREVSVVVKLATGNSGILVNWGNVAGTTYIYRITISAGNVQFGHNNALLTSITTPNVGATQRLYAIHWSTDYDRAAATYYSEMAVCDLATGTWATTRITHTQPNAAAGGDQFNVIGRGAGSSPFTGGIGVVDYVRVGCRFHSTTEAKEDWYAQSSAPSVDGVQLPVELAPASTSYYTANPVANDLSDAILDAGSFAGPAEFAATINAAANRKRLIGPLLNEEMNGPPIYQDTFLPANFHRPVILGGSPDLRLTVSHLYRRNTYSGIRARVWVHAQTYIAAGAPVGTTVANYLQVGSCSKIPPSTAVLTPPGSFTAQVLSTTDHGSTGIGEWFDLGEMSVLTFDGASYFVLAYGFGTGTGHTYLRTVVKGIRIEGYEE